MRTKSTEEIEAELLVPSNLIPRLQDESVLQVLTEAACQGLTE